MILWLLCICFFLFSCKTNAVYPVPDTSFYFKDGSKIISSTSPMDENSIQLSFAGDIMGHKENYNTSDFNLPYSDIKDFLSQNQFNFVNLETPVVNTKPYSSYPAFNVHTEYVEAAIKAGFNVFSLANNHTNDMLLEGIQNTKKYFDSIRNSVPPVYSSGLKDTIDSPFSWTLIQYKDWKILYLAVTELLNRRDYAGYINYLDGTKKSENDFLLFLKELKEENLPDLFILSFHSKEPEYILKTNESQKSFYKRILNSGVDIINANHPHVPKPWEVFTDQEGNPSKIIFYSQGNTLSGQRRYPELKNPSSKWEYLGDSFITQVRFSKSENHIKIDMINPLAITSYIAPNGDFLIKQLNDNFINQLKKADQNDWAYYLTERKNIIENIKGKLIWQ